MKILRPAKETCSSRGVLLESVYQDLVTDFLCMFIPESGVLGFHNYFCFYDVALYLTHNRQSMLCLLDCSE